VCGGNTGVMTNGAACASAHGWGLVCEGVAPCRNGGPGYFDRGGGVSNKLVRAEPPHSLPLHLV